MTVQTVLVPKSVELSTGVTLQYVEQGDLGGVPVLLLHGGTDSRHSFDPLLPCLPASWRAIAVTQRGHGDSSRPAHGYGPRDFAEDIAAFQDALGLGPSVIVGHSLSTSIGQRFALDYPERTRALVTMGSFRNWREMPGIIEFWQQVVMPLTDPIDVEIAREFQESTLAQPIPASFLDLVIAESLKVPARVWRDFFASFADAEVEHELPALTTPTLILWGDQDNFCSEDVQEFLEQTIPNAQLIVYPGHGHAIHWEDPGMIAADLIPFVEDDGC